MENSSDANLTKLHRHSLCLPAYDYSLPGRYFVTICTHGGLCLFGDVQNGAMRLNELGNVAKECLVQIPKHFPNTEIDALVVMPNHLHGIIVITAPTVGARHAVPLRQDTTKESFGKPVAGSLSTIVRSYKSAGTKRVNEIREAPGLVVWQRNYYEHIIRTDKDLNKIREYILVNPSKWGDDEENPARRDKASAVRLYGKTVSKNG